MESATTTGVKALYWPPPRQLVRALAHPPHLTVEKVGATSTSTGSEGWRTVSTLREASGGALSAPICGALHATSIERCPTGCTSQQRELTPSTPTCGEGGGTVHVTSIEPGRALCAWRRPELAHPPHSPAAGPGAPPAPTGGKLSPPATGASNCISCTPFRTDGAVVLFSIFFFALWRQG